MTAPLPKQLLSQKTELLQIKQEITAKFLATDRNKAADIMLELKLQLSQKVSRIEVKG